MRFQAVLSLFGREPTRSPFETLCVVVQKDAPVRFVCPAAVRVTCLSGTAWMTTEGDLRDAVLEAGHTHVAARGDRLFINGMPDCQLRIVSVQALN